MTRYHRLPLTLTSVAGFAALTVASASASAAPVDAVQLPALPGHSVSLTDLTTDLDLLNPPSRPAADVDALVAYSFGTRIEEGDDPDRGIVSPGPVNEQLADAVMQARGGRDIPVYAQFEIAGVLQSTYGLDDVHVIDPVQNEDGTVTYLSTDGVAKQVADRMGSAVDTSTVGVIAFQDHLWRSTYTSRVNGLHAFAVADVAMPSVYDTESGQEWTRSRDAYLPRDYAGRLALLAQVDTSNAATVLGSGAPTP